ncbi:MAG: class I SAM-dependent methyltransferase [Candidatus Aminicenantes bacterium]
MMQDFLSSRLRQGVLLAFVILCAATAGGFVPGGGPQDKVERSEQIDLFDRGRWSWQQPSKIMDALGVELGMAVADIGAGYGYFTLGLAGLVGDKGVVYANDIDERYLRVIEDDCRKKNITNVVTVLGGQDDPKLPAGKLDLALMVDVMPYLADARQFLTNVRRGLKPDGVFAVVEWVSEKVNRAGKIKSSEEIKGLLEACGYSVVKVETFLPRQNVFVCRIAPASRPTTRAGHG